MAIKDTDLITVRNRNRGETGFEVDGKWTMFAIDEVKKIPFATLQSLTFIPGGQFTLDNYLVIENKEALELLNMHVEPEYFYTDNEIRKILFEKSYDEFADFLDFAPKGAIEKAKNIAVQEEMPDMRKREMLGKKTGLNITSAIMINHLDDEDENKDAAVDAPKRRVPINEEGAKQRRAEVPADADRKIVIKK